MNIGIDFVKRLTISDAFAVRLHVLLAGSSGRCLSVGLGYGYTAQNNDQAFFFPSLSVNRPDITAPVNWA